ncbi:MAG: GumC family protein [Gemmatimonadaceae bacterium]
MPDSNLPSVTRPATGLAPSSYTPPPAAWGPAEPPDTGEEGLPWGRYIAAILRFKWLIAAIVILGGAAGATFTRFIAPVYTVSAKVWVASETPDRDRGPIRAEELLTSGSWIELLRSGVVLDPVVRKRQLYLLPASAGDSLVFGSFAPTERMRSGIYELRVDRGGTEYMLVVGDENVVERGAIGDSIGRAVGFGWRPGQQLLPPGGVIRFAVVTPREASLTLAQRITAILPQGSNFLRLTLSGNDPQKTAATLNEWVDQFLATAAVLKKRELVEFTKILEEQLRYAERELRKSEIALEDFKISTITKPSEGTPVAGGSELTRDPVFESFFNQKLQFDDIRRDREALENIIAEARRGSITPEAFLSVPSILEGSQNLRTALSELNTKESQLRSAREFYTDEHHAVKDLVANIETLRTQTIPALATRLLDQLRRREGELDRRIASASREMREIPTRTIEEMRLQRQVGVADNLYTSLKSRYEEARLAEASAVPDVQLLDSAVAPQFPSNGMGMKLILMAVLAGFGIAIALAILLDHLDRRIRYPSQVTRELGLNIIGGVPSIRKVKRGKLDPEEASQVVEAFRTIRLGLSQAREPDGPLTVTITSPNAGDGKSFVSSNLALSFAEAGYRTLLVDGDIRRGQLHDMFGADRRPGLVDCLLGDARQEEIVRPSTHHNLTLIPCGARRRRGPELLSSESMNALMRAFRAQYDAIVVDSPPLSAGIDPFALGATTHNLVIVLRTGESDRKLAEAKLEVLDRLPVRILGAVLNDIGDAGAYRYYSYEYGYHMDDEEEEEVRRLPAGIISR